MTPISLATSLASHATSHASSSKHPHVTLCPVVGREHLAVAAVRGDGIWTYDISTMRPTTSFTVPPSTIFATRPISFYPPPRVSNKPTKTPNVIEEEDVSMEGDDVSTQRVTAVGVLKGEKMGDEEQGRVIWVWRGEEGEHVVLKLKSALQAIHHVQNYRGPILCVHTNGHVTIFDSTLQLRPVTISPSSNIIASRVVHVKGNLIRVMMVSEQGDLSTVELHLSGPDEIEGKVVKSQQLASGVVYADISEDGVVTAIDQSHHLISQSSMTQQTYPRLIHPCSTPPLTLSTPGVPLALLATSHPTPTILLVSTSPSLPAVLATSSLSLLAPTASSTITDIAVIPRTSGPMIVGVTLSYNGEDGGRSVVYTLEVTIPEKGVGMNLLLGTQAITREYIKVEESSNHSLDEAISEFKKVATNSEKSNAKEILSRWLKAETDKAASLHSEQTVKRIIDAVFSLALKQEEGEVKPTGLYVDGIIRDLISRRCVTDEMYPGGVVSALTALSDWTTLTLAIRHIPTIPSSSLVRLVSLCLHTPSDRTPSLKSLLALILAGPSPPPDYRAALARCISVEDATAMLEVYAGWMEEHVEKKNEGLARWCETGQTPKKDGMPSLEAIITHSSQLIDSHLALFLSHPPSHPFLEKLQESLTPLLAQQDTYRRLRAPVESVLTLARREARRQEERQAKNALLKGMAGKKGVKGGDATLPDQVVGKWRVEEFSF